MTRRAARTDNQHAEIRAALRAAGFLVYDTARLGAGYPDLVVIDPDTGRVYLLEVKASNGEFTGPEVCFILSLVLDCYRVVVDAEQAVKALRAVD